jgi:hypothetical protein
MGLASHRLNRISKNTGDDLLGMVKQHRERVGNRRARYQQLTVTGRKQLVVEVTQFERVMGAITRIIQTT